jgi:hypothetical protein
LRMWNVAVDKLCRKHLMGEHVEMHMFVGTINKLGQSRFKSTKYVSDGLVEVHHIKQRHEDLVAEMTRRGMNHKSPLAVFESFVCGEVDIDRNEKELGRRCEVCKFEDDGLPSESPRFQTRKVT